MENENGNVSGPLLDDEGLSETAKQIAAEQKKIEAQHPACPHCGAKPVSFLLRQLNMSGYVVAVMFCANAECNKLLPAQVLGIPQPKVVLAPAPGANGKLRLT